MMEVVYRRFFGFDTLTLIHLLPSGKGMEKG